MRRVISMLLAVVSWSAAHAAGWVELFDGRTLDGWESQTKANWRVAEAVITAGDGEPGLLVTTRRWKDYEIEISFRAEKGANSGVLLSTRKTVTDPATECYEINIAPASNPYPTGSLVGRVKYVGARESPEWRTFRARVDSGTVTVWLDGVKIVEYKDRKPLEGGHIGLQFREGSVQFRSIRLQDLTP